VLVRKRQGCMVTSHRGDARACAYAYTYTYASVHCWSLLLVFALSPRDSCPFVRP
jgi:hypothetical protein